MSNHLAFKYFFADFNTGRGRSTYVLAQGYQQLFWQRQSADGQRQ
jgi:hypothetical protein